MNATDTSTQEQFLPAVTQEQFRAMSVQQRWVAVAKDVLAQLDAARVVPETGAWVLNGDFLVNRENLLRADVQPCSACAVGAAFLSVVRLGNCFNETEVGFGAITDLMDDLLDKDTMYAMEYLYEQGHGFVDDDGDSVLDGHCVRVADTDRLPVIASHDPKTRMRAIMQLLIDNGGRLY